MAVAAAGPGPQPDAGPSQELAGFRPPGQHSLKPARPASAATAKAPAALHDPSQPGALILNMQQVQSSKVLIPTLHVAYLSIDPELYVHLTASMRLEKAQCMQPCMLRVSLRMLM
jgi:hypothetical protein